MNVLVTGAAGYIGSHAVLDLMTAGHEVTALDDFSRGNRGAIDALRAVGSFEFIEGDFGDHALMAELFRRRSIDLVMHFAALTYVGESVARPLDYYRNNTANALTLLRAMDEAGVARFVFSSTCATYGEPPPERIPIREDCPQQPINPYGFSKLAVERMLRDHQRARIDRGKSFAFAALRYFNVAGSDPDGRLGEDHDPETHLVPICLDAALGLRDGVTIFGTDYPTPDGTCIRDYMHVSDLIAAHLAAMEALEPGAALAFNVGIGRGYSVREVIDGCRRVTGRDFAVREGERRPGDPPRLFADARAIQRSLGWRPRHTELDPIITDAWRWRCAHPDGYGD